MDALGFSPSATSVAMLPYALGAMIGGAPRTSRWGDGRGLQNVAVGFTIQLAGIAILCWISRYAPGYHAGVLAAIAIAGFGQSICFVVLLAIGTEAVGRSVRAHLGSAVGAAVI